MVQEKLSREEAVQFLTMKRDQLDEVTNNSGGSPDEVMVILRETGTKVGYTPAFRCLVMGLEPEQSIRWGK